MGRVVTDMTGRMVTIPDVPQRIISVVPSQTELLYDLGLDNEVVGITKFCVHPNSWFRNKTRVGGTKNLRMEAIDTLCPDLIIANKEENTKEQIEALAMKYPVWVSDITTVAEAKDMIRAVGDITGRSNEAQQIIDKVSLSQSHGSNTSPLRVAYFIWRKPWMCAGSDTFISDMIRHQRWENVVTELRYPEVAPEALRDMDVDVVLLSSEPYPFKDVHIQEIKEALPGVEVVLVDGEMFSWYGSRMMLAGAYMQELSGILYAKTGR